ncbi:MAG: tRNA (N6-isopentenyl adenosine(37)-C2)-methylthiotransferase MiaB, partial [candidate division Zixibacteria bacterium]|nr:tRNA (N6-isopentenyl adenosine(37)-C2)-methylthiotransferase MiaB [candidate division Zixibacteria bacterium]
PHMKVAVVGCMAQRLGEKLVEKAPQVDFVLGTDRVFELPDVVAEGKGVSPINTAFGHENIDTIEPSRETPFSAFVTISRGCDNYCTYCIVPFVRGREVAHSADVIVESVRKLVADGVVEITLLGQNVNSYHHGEIAFPELMQRLVEETDLARLRFMTSHPKDISKHLLEVMAGSDRIMPHIHLPLQSGSSRVLEAMGRKYTAEHYLGIVGSIREKLPYVSLTTDLMVGFPTETEEEYEQTLQVVKTVQFDSAFMFRYSVRPGTAAAKQVDDVPENIKIERLQKLIELQQAISYDRNQREVGRVVRCLVEGVSRRDAAMMRGRTEGNKIVLFKTGAKEGDIVSVSISSADAYTLHGHIMEEN